MKKCINLLALTKLFEIQIFGCAIGDFTKTKGPIIFIRNIRNNDSDVFCKCIGITIPDELKDLPKYASCGLIRFKMTMFRETTYRLLTENQKIELHNQALKYLQYHTRRCISCGEGRFVKLLGEVRKIDQRKKTIIQLNEIFEEEIYEEEDIEDEKKKGKIFLTCMNIFRTIEKKPTLTFSDLDFSNCLCDLILMTTYTQMLEHCRGIGKLDVILTALLEFAEICIISFNIPQARKLLKESENVLEKLLELDENEIVISPFSAAKIQILQGQCLLETGSIFEAEELFEKAMLNLGYKFPKLEMMIDLNSKMQLLNLKLKFIFMKDIKYFEEDYQDYTKQLATCLIQMFKLYRIKGMRKHARLAAIWSLNAALDLSSKDASTLCISLSNMLITAHMYQDRYIIPYLEEKGILISSEKTRALEAQELKVIAQLYAAIFFSRWLRGDFPKAINIGFITNRIATTIGSTSLKILILPRLIHLLLLSCRLSEVITQLRELEFVSQNHFDKSGRTWYYALCADIYLDTGMSIVSFQVCEQYFLHEGERMISLYNPEAENRYFICMWLWCIRTEQWDAAKVWRNRIIETPIMDEHIVAATITFLKKLEGLLILYVHKLNTRNIAATITIREIKNMFKYGKKMTKIVIITIPRYMLLKAYYWMIKSQKSRAIKMLKKVKKLSEKMENKLILIWAQHCEKVWLSGISPLHTEMWKEISKVDKWDEINANNSHIVVFTFPLPNYLFL